MLVPLNEQRLAIELRMLAQFVRWIAPTLRRIPIVYYPQYSHEPRFAPSSLPDRANAAEYVRRLRKRLHDGDIQSLDCRESLWPLLEKTYEYLAEYEIIEFDEQRLLMLPLHKGPSYWNAPEEAGISSQLHAENGAGCFDALADAIEVSENQAGNQDEQRIEVKKNEPDASQYDGQDLSPQAKAMAFIVTNPDATITEVARFVGVNRQTLYKPAWKSVVGAIRYSQHRELPRGEKSADGAVEGILDD